MRAALVFAVTLCASAAVAASAPLDPKDGTVLPQNVSKELLHQCSRGAPQGVTGTWLPAPEQIRELESRLSSALGAVATQRGERYAQPAQVRRQYAGLIISGRKIIYVNGFPHESGNSDWSRRVVIVCDGGPAFFGVEYDPATKTFSHFEFNGPL